MKKLAHILVLLAACLVLAAPAAAQLDEWAMPAATTWEGHAPELVWAWSAEHGTLRPSYGGPAGSESRATEATVIRNGRVATVPAGQPSVSNQYGGQTRLEIQPARTNEFSENGDLFNAPWSHSHVTVAQDGTIAPDGSATAWLATVDDDAGSRALKYTGAITAEEDRYTLSIWVQAAASDNLMFGLYQGGFVAATGKIISGPGAIAGSSLQEVTGLSTTQWTHIVVTTDGNCFVADLGSYFYPGGVAAGGAGNAVYFWRPQLEKGTVATATIFCDGAPTSRAASHPSFLLPRPLKNIASVEEPNPTPVLTQSAGDIVLATVAGGGIAMPDEGSPVDLSPYAGGGYVLKVTDGGGKTAWARIASAGSGETQGSELVSNGGFDSGTTGWAVTNNGLLSSVAGGQSGNCLQIEEGGGTNPYAYQSPAGVAGWLYRYSIYVKQGTESTYRYGIYGDGYNDFYSDDQEADGTWTQHSAVFTGSDTTPSPLLYQIAASGTGTTILFDTVSLKQVTAPPTTGVWLESTPGAADGTWSHIDSGFNANAIATWSVIPANQWRADGMLLVEGWVPAWNAVDDSRTGMIIIGVSGYLLYLHGAAEEVRSYDNTNIVYVGLLWESGTSYDLAVRWSSRTNQLQVGCKLSSASSWSWGPVGAFDGTFLLGDTLHLGATQNYAPHQMARVRFFNAWLSDSQLAWMDSLKEWVACADDYFPARAVAGM
ncbi:MAG: hypothetical protein KQI62_02290 [Deltaproteobacteria bacterium]|nr:hypothetical protein [Deltaproteobacteria bacterium]